MTNDLEERMREELLRLHGAPIRKEMGGKVKHGQARMLLDLLEIDYDTVVGEREARFGTTRCVDLSDCLKEAELF